MDKLSLYDILGMLLPGFLFLFMLLALNQVFGISPYFEELNTNAELKELSVIFSFATIFGAIFFTSNFYLVNKTNWYNKVFRMYDHVADIYLNFGFLHSLMNKTLNKKSINQYGKPIFFSNKEYHLLSVEDKNNSRNLQNEYYDLMYYELEHFDKISYAKTFQSFYFFFRQLVTVFSTILLISIGIYLFRNLLRLENWADHYCFIIKFVVGCLLMIFTCVQLAKWYRKRMVLKMYWAYYSFLNNQEKNNK